MPGGDEDRRRRLDAPVAGAHGARLRVRRASCRRGAGAPAGRRRRRSRTSARARERLDAVAEPSALSLGAGELDRRREEHRPHVVETRARRCDRQHGARAIRRLAVQEVVVHLHHDLAAGLERHTRCPRGAGRPRRPAPTPRSSPSRSTTGRAGDPRSAEARPAWPGSGIESSCVLPLLRCDPEEDHVVHDLRRTRLDAG